ncbi:MAG: hypothetical protein IKO10_17325 [Lachnospiraceae bacterium]|nr:hypothetical protein [Lachnospiraceae bacterium]
MYVASRRSSEKMVHDENCRYAKMIAPHNRECFPTTQEAYEAGKTACIHCAAVMRTMKAEMRDLCNICEANGISVIFDATDGTLEIISKVDSWKLATVDHRNMLYLYHKNTANFSTGYCPYDGYHYQKQWYPTILKHLQYIVCHDSYKIEKAKEKRIREQNDRLYFHTKAETIRSGRKVSKMRSHKRSRLTARQQAKYAAGMWY